MPKTGEMNMDLLDYAEHQGTEAAKFSLATLTEARQRCHHLLVLLLGGAGALAGVGLAQWHGHRWAAVAALAVALWWFAVSAWLTLRGLRTSPVTAWAYDGTAVLEMHQNWQAYGAERALENEMVNVPHEVRSSVIRGMQRSAEQYRAASGPAMRALDRAYLGVACTPAPLALVGLVAYLG
jgi:hypothetical protein